MSEIDELFEKVNEGPIDNDLRLSIADTISVHIDERKESLGSWEKSLFAQAISALAMNVGAKCQPTDSWLRLCLVALEKALVPKEERNEEYTKRDEQVEAITYGMLVDAIDELKKEIEK